MVKEYETVFPIIHKNVRDEFSLLIKRSFKCTFETFLALPKCHILL